MVAVHVSKRQIRVRIYLGAVDLVLVVGECQVNMILMISLAVPRQVPGVVYMSKVGTLTAYLAVCLGAYLVRGNTAAIGPIPFSVITGATTWILPVLVRLFLMLAILVASTPRTQYAAYIPNATATT